MRTVLGWQAINRVQLTSPHAGSPSRAWQSILGSGVVQLLRGNEYRLELGFDQETHKQQLDLRPDLPLILHW